MFAWLRGTVRVAVLLVVPGGVSAGSLAPNQSAYVHIYICIFIHI